MEERQTILVIDDSSSFSELTLRSLKQAGYTALGAATALEGLQLAKKHCPELILLNVILPDSNGFELCRQLKAMPALKKSFIMFLSAVEDDSDKQAEGLEAGADGFISKSMSDRELLARVNTMLRIEDTELQLSAVLDLLQQKHNALLRAQKRIDVSQRDYEELYNFAPVGYCTLNSRGTVLQANQTLIELLKADKTPLIGSSFVQHVLKEDRASFYRHLHSVFNTNQPQYCEIQLRNRSGEVVWSLLQSVFVKNAEEPSYECRTAVTDISARKKAESALEKRSHDLAERVKELNCLFDLTRLMEKPGVTAEEILQGTVELVPDALQHSKFCRARISLNKTVYVSCEFSDTPWRIAVPIFVQNQEYGLLEVFYLKEVPYGPEGLFLREEEELLTAVAERLGKYFTRKRAEHALQDSEDRYRLLVETMNEGLATVDENGIFSYVNQKFCELIGRSCYELSGRHSAEVIAPQSRDMHLEQLKKHRLGEAADYEIVLIRKDGTHIPVILAGSPLFDVHGSYKGALGVFTDISKLKSIEDALRKSETRFRALFEDSPISLWEVDLSRLKLHFDDLREKEIGDYKEYLETAAGELQKCAEMVQVVDVNKAAVALYKAGRKERLLTSLDTVFGEASYHLFLNILVALFDRQNTFEIEARHRTLTGDTIYIRLKYSIAPEYQQTLSRVLVSIINLTERQRIEDKLAQERKLLNTLMDGSQDCIYFKDLESRFIRLNNALAARIGVDDPERAVGKTDFDFYSEEHALEAFQDEKEIIRSGLPIVAKEEKETWADGRFAWVSSTKMPLHNEQGAIVGTFGISRDIARQKRLEERQQLATEILELLNRSGERVDTIRGILHLLRRFTGIDAVGLRLRDGQNFPYYESYGSPEKFIMAEKCLCAADPPGERLRDSQKHPQPNCMCENILLGRSDPTLPGFTEGGSFWTHHAAPVMTSCVRQGQRGNRCNDKNYQSVALIPLRSTKRTIGLLQFNDRQEDRFSPELIKFFEEIGTSIAIALENKQTEEDMTRLRNFMKSMIDSMPSVLVGIDRHRRVTHWNFEAEKMTGVHSDEAQGCLLEELIPQLKDSLEQVQSAIQLREPQKTEKIHFLLHDETRYVNMMVYPLTSNSAGGAVVRVDDVTERVRIEEMMIQSEKMASVGGLAAGMAHELNNPLAAILHNTQVVLNRLTKPIPANLRTAQTAGISLDSLRRYMEQRDIFKMLEMIRNSGERAAQIVADMLSFSRKGGLQSTLYDVRELLDGSITLAAHLYDPVKNYDFRQIEILRNYDPTLPRIPCNPNQIQQVILNLLTNAAQALAEAHAPAAAPTISLRAVQEEKSARIEIEDNGPGMPEHVRKRVFEPFFTTKDVGVGTGLGLAVSYFIIKEHHGGSMRVESTVGAGTKFILLLPLAEPPCS